MTGELGEGAGRSIRLFPDPGPGWIPEELDRIHLQRHRQPADDLQAHDPARIGPVTPAAWASPSWVSFRSWRTLGEVVAKGWRRACTFISDLWFIALKARLGERVMLENAMKEIEKRRAEERAAAGQEEDAQGMAPSPSTATRKPSSGVKALFVLVAIASGLVWLSSNMGEKWSAKTDLSFGVTFDRELEQGFAPSECGPSVGGGCRYDRPIQRLGPPRLKVQSLNDKPIEVKKVIVNENEECSANPLTKLANALKSEGRDSRMLEAAAGAIDGQTGTMKYGEVAVIPLYNCLPAKVRIVTDRGQVTYDMQPDRR
jgi:hypothetical protein